MRRPSGFTLVEMVFVMAVATIVIVILIEMLTSFTKNSKRGEDTLDFLRQATILLDHVRTDIRSAGRGPTVSADGSGTLTVKRDAPGAKDSDSQEEVNYTWDSTNRMVTRAVKGGKNDKDEVFGKAGPNLGFITHFAVTPNKDTTISFDVGTSKRIVEVNAFYTIELAFASEEELRTNQGQAKAVHTFKAIVAKRAPEMRDDLWQPNQPPAAGTN